MVGQLYIQKSSTIDTFLSKKTICLFNKCVDKALNFKELYFVNTSLNVYKIHLRHCCFFCIKYTALGESFVTNIIALVLQSLQ